MKSAILNALMFSVASGVTLLLASPIASAQPSDPNPETRLVDLQFGGGTIAEYLEALRQQVGKEVSIVVADPRAGQPMLPAIELNDVAVIAAVHLVSGEYILEDGTALSVSVQSLGGRGQQHGSPLFRVSANVIGWRAPQVRVWSLSDLIDEQLTAEDVLSAVELAVSLVDTTSKTADIRFHEATSLLVASGTRDQIGAINSVIDRLNERRKARIAAEDAEGRVDGIEEMHQPAGESQRAAGQADSVAPQPGAPHGGIQTPSEREARLLHEIERLVRLIDDQQKKIEAIEKRLDATPK